MFNPCLHSLIYKLRGSVGRVLESYANPEYLDEDTSKHKFCPPVTLLPWGTYTTKELSSANCY